MLIQTTANGADSTSFAPETPLQGTVSQEDAINTPGESFRVARPTAQPENQLPLYQDNVQQLEGRQSALLNFKQPSDRSASPQINGSASQLQSSLEQQTPLDEHGEAHMGVLGGPFNFFNGVIIQVFPGSDLNRFGIHPGDKYLGINGHKFNSFTFVQECHGLPGSIINLVVLHDGQVMNIAVRRMDGREAYREAGNGWGGNYRWAAGQNQYW